MQSGGHDVVACADREKFSLTLVQLLEQRRLPGLRLKLLFPLKMNFLKQINCCGLYVAQ